MTPPVVESSEGFNAAPSGAELAYRLRQQQILSDFGLYALRCDSLDALLQKATELCAEGMDTHLAKVLEHQTDSDTLLVRAGVGWAAETVGRATVGADLQSPAGYALKTGEPVISNHLENEERFRTPELLADHDVKRAINVIIRGYEDRAPYGVLEADSPSEGQFDRADIAFMQGFANLLGVAIERGRAEAERDEALASLYLERERLSAVIDQMPSGLVVVSAPEGRIIMHNDAAVRILGHPMPETVDYTGYKQFGAVHGDGRRYAAEEYPTARALLHGETVEQEGMLYRRSDDRLTDLVVSAAPVRDETGNIVKTVCVFNDVSEFRGVEHALRLAMERQEVLTREMSHRVKNSLAQVASLLGMQARGSKDPAVQHALKDATSRVGTIAEVHDQLWRGWDLRNVDLSPFLQDLCDNIQQTAPDHRIVCNAASVTVSADLAIPVGLLTNELVTNALKYAYPGASGEVRVTLTTQDPDIIRLEVADDGVGLPEGFDIEQPGGSLGTRLIGAFTRQLGGGMQIQPGRGTRFVLEMPEAGPYGKPEQAST